MRPVAYALVVLAAALTFALAGCYTRNIRTRCDPTQLPGSFDSCGSGGWLYPPDAAPPPMFDGGTDLPLPPLPARPPRPNVWCSR